MKSHIKCARCGKKPRHKSAKSRADFSAQDLGMLRREAGFAQTSGNNTFAQTESNQHWQSMLRPDHDHQLHPQQQRQQQQQQQQQQRQKPQPKQRRGSITMLILPKGWSTAVDGSTGKTYYYHAKTRETSWEHPGRRQVDVGAHQKQAARQIQAQQQQAQAQGQAQAQQMRARMNVQAQQQISASSVRGTAQQDHRAQQRGGRRRGGGGGGGNIFDRLTDSSQYTGAHKHRFDKNGQGKGLAGRDRVMKGSGYVSARTHEGREYVGSTNTGTNQVYHDSSQFLMRR